MQSVELLCFNPGSCYELWQLCRSCKSLMPANKKTEAGAFFLSKQRNRGSEAALVGGLCGAGVSGPRSKSSGTKILPRLSTQWWRVYFCPCFLGHFRPIFEPRCPRVPCYPPVDRSPHFGRTPATSELGLDWASFPRVGLRPDIGFSNIPAPDNLL